MQEAKFTDFTDETTRKQVRRKYLHEKLDAYTAELRKNQFPVEVYQDRLVQLEQQEADMVKTLAEKAKQPGSVTEKRIKELQKLMKPRCERGCTVTTCDSSRWYQALVQET